MEDLQQERELLAAEWEKLRVAKAEFEAELGASSIEQKLFVGNLCESTTEEEVRAYFEPFGNIKEVFMLKDKDGKSKRSSFVKLFKLAAAERAIEAINGKLQDKTQEKMMVVRFAAARPAMGVGGFGQQTAGGPFPGGPGGFHPMQQQFGGPPAPYGAYGAAPNPYARVGAAAGRGPSGSNLYINNVAASASEEEVRTMFSDFGTVLSIKLFASQGYGFVSYDNPQSASNAIHALNGLAIGNGQKRLEVSIKKDGRAAPRFNPY